MYIYVISNKFVIQKFCIYCDTIRIALYFLSIYIYIYIFIFYDISYFILLQITFCFVYKFQSIIMEI